MLNREKIEQIKAQIEAAIITLESEPKNAENKYEVEQLEAAIDSLQYVLEPLSALTFRPNPVITAPRQ